MNSVSKMIWLSTVALWTALLCGIAIVAEANTDFALLDTEGNFHRMSYYNNYDEIVILVASSQSSEKAKGRFLGTMQNKPNAKFFFLNPTGEDRNSEQNMTHVDVPMLMDDAKIVSKALNITQLNEVLFIETQTWNIKFRQALDVGESVDTDFDDPSYVADVAPILIENCVMCHRPGGIGPWAMTNHQIVQAFSPAIREAVMTKRMPPGQLDPTIGEFTNSMTLTLEEQQKLIQWIDNGSQGDYND